MIAATTTADIHHRGGGISPDELWRHVLAHDYQETLAAYGLSADELAQALIGVVGARMKVAYDLRQHGKGYPEIAAVMRVKENTAREYVSRYHRIYSGMPTRKTDPHEYDAVARSKGRKCRRCGANPYPNYFYCPGCHARITDALDRAAEDEADS